MIVAGLTGSIGMGKSTATNMLRQMGVPVHDSDQAVHKLLAVGGAGVAPILAVFPDAAHPDGSINRSALGRIIFNDIAHRRMLESILHPRVVSSQTLFIADSRRRGTPLVVLDIPLLFETAAEKRLDYTIVVTAPYFMQRLRLLKRGMSHADIEARIASQMPDGIKRARADFVVQTGLGLGYTRRELKKIVKKLVGYMP